jgi:streptomycin 3"-adenylyltransferase
MCIRDRKYPVNLLLNACRTAAALLDKKVLSKSEGGLWGLQKLPQDLRFLIRKALDVYDNNNPAITFSREELENFIGIMDPLLQQKEGK